MARVIKTVPTTIFTLHVDTILEDESVLERLIKIGDIVENLRYQDGGEIKTVSGRVLDFNIMAGNNISNKYDNTSKDDFRQRFIVRSITLDASEQYKSTIVEIDTREMVEDDGVENVAKMDVFLSEEVSIAITRSNDTTETVVVRPDMYLANSTFRNPNVGGSDIVGTFKLITTVNTNNGDCTGFVLKDSSKVFRARISEIIDINPVEQSTDVDSVRSTIESVDTDIVVAASMTYTDAITLNKSFTFYGNKCNVFANSGKRAYDGEVADETILEGRITVDGDIDVEFNGITFTKDSLIQIDKAKSITIKNCRFIDMRAMSLKTMMINLKEVEGYATKVVVENCFFGRSERNGENVIYHNFELTGFLKAGSSISMNRFILGTVTHNNINVYNVEDDATITINRNYFDFSGNGVRIGTKYDAKCNIIISGNKYDATDGSNDGVYAGLLCIQPYGSSTTNMSRVKIQLGGTNHKDKFQFGYRYYKQGRDLALDDTNSPLVTVNGNKTKLPLIVG